MPRLQPVDPDKAQGKAKTLLDGFQKSFGMTPNLIRTLAHSPAALDAYLGSLKALSGGSLDPALREVLALAVAAENDCQYCIAAHTAIGKRLGVDDAELTENRAGRSADPQVAAALRFAQSIVATRGWVGDDDLRQIREAGYSDGEIVEIIATVGLNVFSNYFDHIAQIEIDFPPVDAGEQAAA